MDINDIIRDLGITPTELARKIGVSDSYVFDLKSGRRKLTIQVASKLEAYTQRDGIVASVVKAKTAA